MGCLWVSVLAILLSTASLAKEIILVHITDTHIVNEWDPDKKRGVSIARAATRIAQIRRENPEAAVFLVHSGDFVSPSSTSRVYRGADVVELLNAMDVDVATIGNHEFDYGAKVLKERIAEAAFQITVANVYEGKERTRFAGLSPFVVLNRKGVRVAFLGVVTRDATQTSAQKLGDPVFVSDPAKAVEDAHARILQYTPNIDFVVGLTHLEHAEDRAVRALDRLPHILLGGHEHLVREELHGEGCPYRKGCNDLEDLRTLHFKYDEAKKRWTRTKEVYEVLDRNIPEDPVIAALSLKHKQRMDEVTRRIVGQFPRAFDGTWKGLAEQLKSGGAELPDFVATLLAKQMQVDISLFNVGSISRSNREYPAGSVSYGTVQQLYPYTDPFVIVSASGAAVQDLISRCVDQGLSRDDDSWFTPLPALGNARAQWSRANAPGKRLTSLEIQGAPLEKKRIYRMALNRFLYEQDPRFKQQVKLLIPIEAAISEFETLLAAFESQLPATGCLPNLAETSGP